MTRSGQIRLKQVEHRRLSDVAVQQIRDLIASGRLKPGDQLLPERDLVAQLGVGRSSVREALRILEAMGLLEVKPGLGTFVTADFSESKAMTLWLAWLLDHENSVRDLLEAREALELRAAQLAVERVTEPELEVLSQIVQNMEQHVVAGSVEGIVTCDREFHDRLCQASRNSFIATLNASLYAALDEARTSVFTVLPRVRAALAQEHHAIYQALQARDVQAVQQAITYHMDSFRYDIKKAVAQRKEES